MSMLIERLLLRSTYLIDMKLILSLSKGVLRQNILFINWGVW